MARIFITASFENGVNLEEIEHLCSLVRAAGMKDFCFIRDVEHYKHMFDNPADLMKRALEEIKKSDYLLIDMTKKPTGRAIEAGMAYALKKKILILIKKGVKIKDTTTGIAHAVIVYEKIDEIKDKLKQFS